MYRHFFSFFPCFLVYFIRVIICVAVPKSINFDFIWPFLKSLFGVDSSLDLFSLNQTILKQI